MHPADVLKYGNLTVLRVVEGLPIADWTTAGVCGWWSVREIIAHLASFEHLLLEALAMAGDPRQSYGPHLRAWFANGQTFNDHQVAARAALSPEETLAEYAAAQAQTMTALAALPPDAFLRTSFLPAYGREYDLEDFITYAFYGHKREHSAQIAVFRDGIRR
jgi:uncharacterized protein (TIGR03083 family)